MQKGELKRRIAEYTYRTMRWGQNHLPPGIRSLVGVLFMVGGMLFGSAGDALELRLLPAGATFPLASLAPGAFLGLAALVAAHNLRQRRSRRQARDPES